MSLLFSNLLFNLPPCVCNYKYLIKFIIFMLFNKNSLDGNVIGDEGGVALGEALKLNMRLQTLR